MDNYSEYYCKNETDKAYLVYYEALSKKIKWIKKHAHLDEQSPEWLKYRDIAIKQAPRVAEGFTHLTCKLLHVGIEKTFSDALKAIYGEELFPSQNFLMEMALRELACTEVSSEFNDDFVSYVACIPERIPEQEVCRKIKDAFGEMQK